MFDFYLILELATRFCRCFSTQRGGLRERPRRKEFSRTSNSLQISETQNGRTILWLFDKNGWQSSRKMDQPRASHIGEKLKVKPHNQSSLLHHHELHKFHFLEFYVPTLPFKKANRVSLHLASWIFLHSKYNGI